MTHFSFTLDFGDAELLLRALDAYMDNAPSGEECRLATILRNDIANTSAGAKRANDLANELSPRFSEDDEQ
jgi:hypothetical protein